jgi:8-amino-7-oxononanoate synthase
MFKKIDFSLVLKKITENHAYRVRDAFMQAENTYVRIDQKKYINFCSNNYLDLAGHPAIKKALVQSLDLFDVGSGASSYVSGYTRLHQQLEEKIADFLGRPKALCFSSGYLANVGILQALMSSRDIIFQDKLNHASLIDGALLSGAKLSRFPHKSYEALSQLLLQSSGNQQGLIVSDGVFSMEGDCADITQLSELSRKHNATLYIDDAHGIGVIGEGGKGSVAGFGYSCDDVPILVGTFGKAFGLMGAFVVGDDSFIEYLTQKTRTAIYSTAFPPAIAGALMKSIDLVMLESWRREKLLSLIAYFKKKMQLYELPVLASNTPIQPVMMGESYLALHVSQVLLDQGFYVRAMRAPTVPEGRARLRITLTAAHEESHIDALSEALANAFFSVKRKKDE